jgi:acyl-CoA hydrolase
MSAPSFRPVSASVSILKELMVPAYANFGGKVHGGVILGLMDKIAYTAAATHARTYCVTASINQVDFLNPVDVGDLLTLHASVNYVQHSSMEVGIRVESENFRAGTTKHTNTSYFTMVAMDEGGNKVLLPGLVLATRDDVRRFIEGRLRRGNQRAQRESLGVLRQHANLGAEIDALKDASFTLRDGLRALLEPLP